MPLIKCVDCGNAISDRAQNCPHCGCPVAYSMGAAAPAVAAEPAAEPVAQTPVEATGFDPFPPVPFMAQPQTPPVAPAAEPAPPVTYAEAPASPVAAEPVFAPAPEVTFVPPAEETMTAPVWSAVATPEPVAPVAAPVQQPVAAAPQAPVFTAAPAPEPVRPAAPVPPVPPVQERPVPPAPNRQAPQSYRQPATPAPAKKKTSGGRVFLIVLFLVCGLGCLAFGGYLLYNELWAPEPQPQILPQAPEVVAPTGSFYYSAPDGTDVGSLPDLENLIPSELRSETVPYVSVP